MWVDDLRDPEARNDNGDYVFVKDPSNWIWAKTITEAVRILAQRTIEEVSLDHDICHAILPGDPGENGKNIYQPVTCPENYSAVARYIAAMTVDERPKTVWIHTANEAGAIDMQNILNDACGDDIMVVRRRL